MVAHLPGESQKALFARERYDAVGFYQHLSEEGINPWTHFDNMLAGFKQDTNLGAYDGAGAEDETFLDTWASGIFKDGTLGPEWNAQGPWVVTPETAKDGLTINNDQTKVRLRDGSQQPPRRGQRERRHPRGPVNGSRLNEGAARCRPARN